MNQSSSSVSSSSSSSSVSSSSHQSSYPTNSPPRKYDVFLSFRGEDTRRNFTSHLYNALNQNTILTFIDSRLVRGEEISPSLLEAIEQSKISVVVFSQDYASSKWCLMELVKILECRKENGQIIIPVFYGVAPSDICNQTDIFGAAFGQHKESDEVQSWRDALKQVGSLSGWDSSIGSEAELIQKIIDDILEKLNQMAPKSDFYKGLVGFESRIEAIKSLLHSESPDDVRYVGIYGMAGLGKTAIARAIYDEIFPQFESCCFLPNVREQLKTNCTQLQYQLFSALLHKECSTASILHLSLTILKDRLRQKKVLIVVDDAEDSRQLKELLFANESCFFGPGSRMIVTSRNKQVVVNIADDKICKMQELNDPEALQLFSMNAFKQDCLPSDRILQAEKVVSYAKGHPLALKVLGSALFRKSDEDWKSMLERLGDIHHHCDIHDREILYVLKTSYDELSDEEKKIFLHIACLFRGISREHVTKILDVAFNISMQFVITTLIDKSLIMVNDSDELEMHDLLQEMGRKIAYNENPTWLLLNPQHLNDALMENKGNGAIEGISLDMSMVPSEIHIESDVFTKMYNIRFINFCGYGEEKLQLSRQGLQSLPNRLTYLNWTKFPLKSIPSKFFPENLVVLRLRDSKVKKLWDGVQNLVNLIEIDLSKSEYLTEIPDLSKAIKIETIKLYRCISLVEVHSSIQYLHKLEFFNLAGCEKLKKLPTRIESKALKDLDMGDCIMVESCPKITQVNMNLEDLILSNCRNIWRLPDSICNLKSLQSLTLDGSRIQELPSSIEHLSCLHYLHLSDCRYLKSLPSSIHRLPELWYLYLSGSEGLSSLPELPPSLGHLRAHNCISLQTISSNFKNCCNLSYANFANCSRLDPKALEAEAQFTTPNRQCELIYPGNEVPGWFSHRSMESSITIQFPLNWDQFKGVVFGIVFEFKEPFEELYNSAEYQIGFKMDRVDLDNSSEGLWSYPCHHVRPNSDHVLIVYQSYNPFKEYSATLSSFQFSPELQHVLIAGRYNNEKAEILKHLKVKRCGVHMLQDDAESIIVSSFKTSATATAGKRERRPVRSFAATKKHKRRHVGYSTTTASITSSTSRPSNIAPHHSAATTTSKRKCRRVGIVHCRSIYHLLRWNWK